MLEETDDPRRRTTGLGDAVMADTGVPRRVEIGLEEAVLEDTGVLRSVKFGEEASEDAEVLRRFEERLGDDVLELVDKAAMLRRRELSS